MPVLAGVECITIFPDADDGGTSIKAAHRCADRWAGSGKEARIITPPAGNDWHDAGVCR
jgi:DNA primase